MRLTKSLISEISSNAIKAAGLFNSREVAEDNLKEFGASIASYSFGEMGEEAAKLRSEYAKFLSLMRPDLRCNFYSTPWASTSTIRCNFAGCRKVFHLDSDVAVNNKYVFAYPADHELTLKWSKLENELKDVNEKIANLDTEVTAFCKSFSTVEGLLKVWPEAAQLLPPIKEPEVVNMPMIQPSKLNEKLGLK
jgi:hypothetical protein